MTIGKTVASRAKLNWWESRALYGWTVLVPRTKDQAGEMSERLTSYGALPIEVPTIAAVNGPAYGAGNDLTCMCDVRIASERAVFASTEDTHVAIRDWFLRREADGRYTTRAPGDELQIDLEVTPTQAWLLQGDQGFSRKGPEPSQASFYVSHPQLAVRGTLDLKGQRFEVQGTAWLDHEWSEALMHPDAVGWDWFGMNLEGGHSITAFQLRRADGSKLWAGGSFRAAGSAQSPTDIYRFRPGELDWVPQRYWTSPRTRARYPVEWMVRTPGDFYTVKAVIDPQELDARGSTGTVYWEGLSNLFDSNGKRVGRGYLEMTGYAKRLVL